MIGGEDIYKVVAAMAPLYFALGLGYGSVKWWKFFTPEQGNAINSLVVYFSMPFFTFDFIVRTNPFAMNYRVIASDAISKFIMVLAMAIWAKCCTKGSYSWSITGFSLSTLNNTLVVGVPLLNAMYGKWAQDLIVQLAVVQSIVWFPLLLLVFELRKAWVGIPSRVEDSSNNDSDVFVEQSSPVKDVEMNVDESRVPFWLMIRNVWIKLVRNPNVYASVIGVIWSCIANRWHLGMPSIIEGSMQIMSKTGTGMAMFSMGLFMALQQKMIACGPNLTMLGMVLRFAAGPIATAIGAIAVGLRGDVLHLAIIQAALPQSIASFVFAKEYGLHADVLSTAVIFGTLASLPLLTAYYVLLSFMK